MTMTTNILRRAAERGYTLHRDGITRHWHFAIPGRGIDTRTGYATRRAAAEAWKSKEAEEEAIDRR